MLLHTSQRNQKCRNLTFLVRYMLNTSAVMMHSFTFKLINVQRNINCQNLIPQSIIKSIITKWKIYDSTKDLLREGRPPKFTDRITRALIRKTTKELESHCVHWTTLSRALHRARLYGKVARKKTSLTRKFAKMLVGDTPDIWKKIIWSD